MRPDDVCLDEVARLEDRAVDVGLGRQVDHGLTPLARLCDRLGVGDVPLVELVRHVEEVLSVARVGQLVEDDDGVTCRSEAASDVAADESTGSGNEDAHGAMLIGVLVHGLEAGT